MAISLAWLAFYYVQRFRYLHAKDRLAVSIQSYRKYYSIEYTQHTHKFVCFESIWTWLDTDSREFFDASKFLLEFYTQKKKQIENELILANSKLALI